MSDETIVSSIDALALEDDKKPYLTFISGPKIGQLLGLEEGDMSVGRSPDCDLWVEDGAISRKHFKLKVRGQEIEIEDLKSTNGTYVNGKRVKRAAVHDGDKIQISKSTIFEINYLDENQSLSEKKRYEMGVIDPVVEIYNKRYFLDRIKDEFQFAKRYQKPLSLVMMDIDHFKNFNDTYGHIVGDIVLKEVGALIKASIREEDLLARYGGEEFVLVLRDQKAQGAVELADRIRQKIENMVIDYEDQKIKVTISMGVSEYQDHADFMALIHDADQKLYQSKEAGRNRVTGP